MTLAQTKLHSPARQRPHRVWSSDEIENLWELAERLQGRPLPGVRVSEAEFRTEYGDEDIKAEWMDGDVIVMAPVSRDHSEINIWLFRFVGEFVEHHDLGQVLGSEFPIRLATIRKVRSPDVMFVSNAKLSKLRPTYLDGAPDLIMEIVSPDSMTRDWRDKYSDYQSTGVKEYWVVDPLAKRVDAYTLGRSKKYSLIQPDDEGRIHSKLLKGLYIDPRWLCRSPLPKLSVVLKELKLR
jgi:Uma2 family endonuclease